MELTYHDIMKADFSALTTTAKQWRKMGNAFGVLRTDYTTHAGKKLAAWQGDSSSAYRITEIAALGQLSDAKKQARSMATLLDDAHDILTAAREVLKRVRDSAKEEGGMKVDEYGKCTLDTSKMTAEEAQAALKDPSRMDAEKSWNLAIQRGVQAVEQADLLIMRSLKAAADGDPGETVGFNSHPPKDLASFAEKLARSEAVKQRKKVTQGSFVKVGLHVLISAVKAPGSWEDRLAIGVTQGLLAANGYDNAQGMCVNLSAGIGASAGLETCLVSVKKPNGKTQMSVIATPAGNTAGWDFGVSGDFTALKSNADDIEQLKGMGWNQEVSYHPIGVGGAVKHEYAMGAENAKGDKVHTYGIGVGPGAGASAETGFGRTYILLKFEK